MLVPLRFDQPIRMSLEIITTSFFPLSFACPKERGERKGHPERSSLPAARYRAYLIRFVVAQNRHPWLTSLNWLPAN